MQIRIRGLKHSNSKIKNIWFPMEEERLYEISNDLGIKITTDNNCYIEEVINDSDMNDILKNKECNIDELNFLFKRMDSFDVREKKKFYASAFAENPKTVSELINLTFNIHCYSLVSDFNNLESVGKDLYLSENKE